MDGQHRVLLRNLRFQVTKTELAKGMLGLAYSNPEHEHRSEGQPWQAVDVQCFCGTRLQRGCDLVMPTAEWSYRLPSGRGPSFGHSEVVSSLGVPAFDENGRGEPADWNEAELLIVNKKSRSKLCSVLGPGITAATVWKFLAEFLRTRPLNPKP